MSIHIMELVTNTEKGKAYEERENQQRPLTLDEYYTLYKKELPSVLNFIRELAFNCPDLDSVRDRVKHTAGCSVRNFDDDFGEYIDIEVNCDDPRFDYIVITLSKDTPVKIADSIDVAIKGLDYEYECLPLLEKLNSIKIVD